MRGNNEENLIYVPTLRSFNVSSANIICNHRCLKFAFNRNTDNKQIIYLHSIIITDK